MLTLTAEGVFELETKEELLDAMDRLVDLRVYRMTIDTLNQYGFLEIAIHDTVLKVLDKLGPHWEDRERVERDVILVTKCYPYLIE